MPRKRRTEPSQAEIIRLALEGIDAQIAALQEKRAQLAKKLPASSSVAAAAAGAKGIRSRRGRRRKRRFSEETRQKLSEAAKARWAARKAMEAKTMEARARKVRARAKARAQANQAA
jgi:hypothetical protein